MAGEGGWMMRSRSRPVGYSTMLWPSLVSTSVPDAAPSVSQSVNHCLDVSSLAGRATYPVGRVEGGPDDPHPSGRVVVTKTGDEEARAKPNCVPPAACLPALCSLPLPLLCAALLCAALLCLLDALHPSPFHSIPPFPLAASLFSATLLHCPPLSFSFFLFLRPFFSAFSCLDLVSEFRGGDPIIPPRQPVAFSRPWCAL